MSWIFLSLLSAVFLGVYGLAKKTAVHENAVPPVLLLNVATSAALYTPVMLISWCRSDLLADTPFYVETITAWRHLLLFSKAVLVGASWTLAFYGLKHLPISIATPIRSTSPLWTILIAAAFLGERPSPIQWFGIATIIIAFFAFSQVGQQEGIHFRSNRWVAMMICATTLGSISALFDKFLLQRMNFSPATLQAWFSVYLVIVMTPLAARWYLRERVSKPLRFRWSIPLIAVTLLIADFLYFTAMSAPDALISVISPLRRTSVVLPFLYGVTRLSEVNWKGKALCILLMLVGVCLVSYQTIVT